MTASRSVFPWFGGKAMLARRIVQLLPPHLAYVEPFGGAANVLLTKRPSQLDVYNDVDDGPVTFFRVLRDAPDELARRLELTPYSRAEWNECRSTWRSVADPVEKARRWYVFAWQAFAGDLTHSGWGADVLGRRHGSRSRTFARRVDELAAFAARLRHVQIESADWREILDRYDAPSACFYLDPPYLPETRKGGGYLHELTTADHVELVERVTRLAGGVVVSGYESELYRELERAGFERFEFPALCAAGADHGGRRSPRLEVVWRRGDVAAQRLFEVAL